MPTRAGYEATERLREQSLNPRHAIEPAVDARRVLVVSSADDVPPAVPGDDRVTAIAALEHVTSGSPGEVVAAPASVQHIVPAEANEEVEERRPAKHVPPRSAHEAASVA